ncbi:MAG: 6-carboxytetrahydropterin synthase [Candidatus Endonucleobacter sp. (ex Gigantidas childressi)]|nr:6-carboxytetrahydropterin synthase [Candidatus Endonucleobacter sp. (ex Gigantidas childressi)]
MPSLFINQLTTLDFSYLCHERGLVGETWIVDAVLTGDLNEQGMIFDFGHVKKQIKMAIDAIADHRLLVPATNPSIDISSTNEQLSVQLRSSRVGHIECKAPAEAIFLVMADAITTSTVTPVLEQALLDILPPNTTGVSLKLYSEAINGHYYHYSHGLKKHDGDCQRIAHGHRSKILISANGKHAPKLEAEWAKRWRDIYIATQADLLETVSKDGCTYNRFGYSAAQGYFELTIASRSCHLIHTDSTVELLAEHVAHQLASENPGQHIQVVAYEGFNKGAISEALLNKTKKTLTTKHQHS